MARSHDKHIEYVEAVNNATTREEHDLAEVRLRAFREGLRAAGVEPDLMGCDLFYMDQGIDRPMCCGVWLDWEPLHTHVAGEGDDLDTCRKCGKDIRNECHIRVDDLRLAARAAGGAK